MSISLFRRESSCKKYDFSQIWFLFECGMMSMSKGKKPVEQKINRRDWVYGFV